ncbi:MAG: hypothetical protein FWG00_02285 [Coriobacteriia bacterium]|nr:hypothetical protein [Coriobacteriia bacterium]
MLAAALSFSLLGCTPGQDAEPASTTSANQDNPATEAEGTKPAEATSSATLDLANPEDYKKINLFLSNFSEALFCVYNSNGYEFDAYDHLGTLAHFAIDHNYINTPGVVELGSYENIDGKDYDIRISAKAAQETIKTFFKQDVDVSTLKDMGYPYYHNGYLYTAQAGGGLGAYGIAVPLTLEKIGDNRYKVLFEVFAGDNYDATDQSLYGLSRDELVKRGFAGYLTGEAVIEPLNDGTIAPFLLVSYSVKDI